MDENPFAKSWTHPRTGMAVRCLKVALFMKSGCSKPHPFCYYRWLLTSNPTVNDLARNNSNFTSLICDTKCIDCLYRWSIAIWNGCGHLMMWYQRIYIIDTMHSYTLTIDWLCMLHRHVGLSRLLYVNKIYSFIHSFIHCLCNAYLGCTYPCWQVALQSVAIANTLGWLAHPLVAEISGSLRVVTP